MNRITARLVFALGTAGALFAAPAKALAPAGRYSVVDGAVVDMKTGLTWQLATSSTTYTYPDAVTYCTSNTPGLPGTGWRLPAIKELQSLVDERATSAPTIDPTIFLAMPSYYWSSTFSATNTAIVWTVSFADGVSYLRGMGSTALYVRCVH